MFVTIANGDISISSGTSGATPTIASIITLVNDARLAAGKKPVGKCGYVFGIDFANISAHPGFINPTVSLFCSVSVGVLTPIGQIYSANFASAFNDITSGTSQGCKGCKDTSPTIVGGLLITEIHPVQGVRDGGFKA